MVQVLNRPQSQGERFMESFQQSAPMFSEAFSRAMQPGKDKKEKEALERITGQDLSGLSPEVIKHMAIEHSKARSLAQQTKHLEKVKAMELGLGTIKQMRPLISSAGGWTSNIGKKIESLIPGSEAQKARGKLESLGTSLIQMRAAGIVVRNLREFDKFAKVISDPDASPAELEGALDGLEDILTRSLESSEEQQEPKKKQKFSPSHPEHRKKAEQLFKTHKDKKKVKEELSKEFEF